MRIGGRSEIEDKFGVARYIKIGINAVYGGLVELGRAVDVKIVVSFGGRGETSGFV